MNVVRGREKGRRIRGREMVIKCSREGQGGVEEMEGKVKVKREWEVRRWRARFHSLILSWPGVA